MLLLSKRLVAKHQNFVGRGLLNWVSTLDMCLAARQNTFAAAPASPKAIVVLMHGLGRSAGCWRPLSRSLRQAGFKPVAIDYPSTRFGMSDLLTRWIGPGLSMAIERASSAGVPVHVVTHSMGGILLRQWLQNNRLPSGSRVVMLAPPNRGSEVIDRLGAFRWFRRWMGPSAMQLSTSPTSHVNGLPNWTSAARLGIVAGTRSADPWFNDFFDGPHDGKVAVKRTYIDGCDRHHTVPATHTWIMSDRYVRRWVLDYLEEGDRPSGETMPSLCPRTSDRSLEADTHYDANDVSA